MKLGSLTLLALVSTQHVVHGQGTSLLNGLIQTSTPVDAYANFALDVKEMKSQLLAGQFEDAAKIYREGGNAIADNGSVLTLKSLSTEATYGDLPPYLFHLYGLARKGFSSSDFGTNRLYAHNYVELLLHDSNSGTLAADAVLALSVWMECSRYLWDTLANCRSVTFDGSHSLERFMSAWIGAEQTLDDGYGLFFLAQKASQLFGNTDALSPTNNDILKLYEKMQKILSIDGTCKSVPGRNSFEETYSLILRIQSKMMIPLAQLLISSLLEEDLPAIKMYAYAFIPQIAQCKHSKFVYLRDKLIRNTSFDKSEFKKIIGVIQSTFDCLGFTCDEVGAYKDDVLPKCVDIPPPYPLAGYHPTTNVHQHGKIDLDILQIRVLCELEAWDQAYLIYTYGKNSFIEFDNIAQSNYRTLKAMAKTKSRNLVAPYYNKFSTFYNDPDYADTTITNAFHGAGSFANMSTMQRAEMIMMTIQYQVMYMYSMAELQRSVDDCFSQDPNRQKSMFLAWDESAAYVIGSLEGPKLGGSPSDGMLLYHLANFMCKEFGTCSGNGWSRAMTIYQELLYAGKGEMEAPDCQTLAEDSRRIMHLVMIPVIQAIIWYAVKLQYLGADSTDQRLAEAEAITRAILPIVNTYSSPASDILERNMLMSGTQPVPDGAQVVAHALYDILDDFGIDCVQIGTFEGVNACRRGEFGSGSSLSHGLFLKLLVTLIVCVFMVQFIN